MDKGSESAGDKEVETEMVKLSMKQHPASPVNSGNNTIQSMQEGITFCLQMNGNQSQSNKCWLGCIAIRTHANICPTTLELLIPN